MDIEVKELKNKLDANEKFIFIDVRELYEYEEFNLGAELIPMGDAARIISEYEDHKNDEIVLHCRSGKRSAAVQSLLQQSGFTNVRNLEGGVLAWKEAFPG